MPDYVVLLKTTGGEYDVTVHGTEILEVISNIEKVTKWANFSIAQHTFIM